MSEASRNDTVLEGRPGLPNAELADIEGEAVQDLLEMVPVGGDAADAQSSEQTYLEREKDIYLESLAQDTKARKEYAEKLFNLIQKWLYAIFFLMLAAGFLHEGSPLSSLYFKLSDTVLVALITSTTATVIGLFIVVVNYIFHRPKS